MSIVLRPEDPAANNIMIPSGLPPADPRTSFHPDSAASTITAQGARHHLHHNPVLALTAADHASDLGVTGAVGHVSTDKTTGLMDRVRRYGGWERKVGECLWYGRLEFVREPNGARKWCLSSCGAQVVHDLVVDDSRVLSELAERSHTVTLLFAHLYHATSGMS